LTGIYTEIDSAPTDWLGATVGLRFDDNSKVARRLSPRAALFLAKREKYGLKFLYAEGFRNPSAFEGAFFDNTTFVAPGMNDEITGGRDKLGAEKIRSFEAVAWAKPLAGLSTRLSGFYWDARDVIVQQPVTRIIDNQTLLQFQNVGRFVTQGVEAEASYRTATGWYGFAGAAYARVGSSEEPGMAVEYGSVADSAPIMAAFGASTPRLFDYAHLSTELNVIGRRPTRPALDGSESPDSPAWFGLNVILYAPNIRGFDVTVAARNLIGRRDRLPAPGDYDRSDPEEVVIPRIPGEGRELYLRVGYAY
jgi:outer membrane receptor protein involved in Fe transport